MAKNKNVNRYLHCMEWLWAILIFFICLPISQLLLLLEYVATKFYLISISVLSAFTYQTFYLAISNQFWMLPTSLCKGITYIGP